jgi:hypothetical protein
MAWEGRHVWSGIWGLEEGWKIGINQGDFARKLERYLDLQRIGLLNCGWEEIIGGARNCVWL